ncbi:MAG TPA: DnaB-like helicase C-terminal domain-containing protein, partial [Acidimicrobiia bacterium]|nr:DnaB-like helicase C-terminal domain-containing protein [Acidimicrobiia bacterium]
VEWAAAALGARPQRVRRGPVDEILLAPALSSCWARRDPLVDWLFSIGVRLDGGPTPGMPSCVSCLSPSQLALFLRHLWAAGGRVSSEQGVPVFTYLSANAGFLADLQRLLFRFGVLSQRRTVEHPGGAVAYELRVTAERSRRRFVAEIGLPSGAPGGWATALDAGSESAGGVARRTFRSAMGETYWGPTLPQERAPSALAALLDDDATFGLVQSDLAWDAVESIEYLGEMPVYDATVPGTHNFVADGIVVHNSIEQDADVVAFIYRDDVYNPESQDRGTAEIIVAKHRNGPTGTVRLAFLEHLTKFENMARVD